MKTTVKSYAQYRFMPLTIRVIIIMNLSLRSRYARITSGGHYCVLVPYFVDNIENINNKVKKMHEFALSILEPE